MIPYKLTFGPKPKSHRKTIVDLIENYLSSLIRNGQIFDEYSLAVQKGNLCVYLSALGPQAKARKYHSSYGLKLLDEIIDFFGKAPDWQLLDDEALRRDTTWTKAPFLFLFTHFLDSESPLCRGDNGRPIPVYRLKK